MPRKPKPTTQHEPPAKPQPTKDTERAEPACRRCHHRWEYKAITWPVPLVVNDDLFNEQAADGWEYVPVSPHGGSLFLLFRRPVEE